MVSIGRGLPTALGRACGGFHTRASARSGREHVAGLGGSGDQGGAAQRVAPAASGHAADPWTPHTHITGRRCRRHRQRGGAAGRVQPACAATYGSHGGGRIGRPLRDDSARSLFWSATITPCPIAAGRIGSYSRRALRAWLPSVTIVYLLFNRQYSVRPPPPPAGGDCRDSRDRGLGAHG